MPHEELFAAMVARLRSWSDAASGVEIVCDPEELSRMRGALGRADLEPHRVAVVVDTDTSLSLRFTDGFVGTFVALAPREDTVHAAA